MPDFARMIDELQYSIIVMIAGVHWGLQKALIMCGYTIKLINNWLIENAFVPIIAQTNDSLRIAVGYVFVVALIILGVTYLLAAFIRLDVVSPRSAIMWYIAGALFFTIGPSFYQGMNDFRLNIAQVMYLSVLDGLGSNAGDFSSLAQVTSDDLDLGELCDYLDVYLPGATGPGTIDGLDIALAYLRGHAQDIMGYPQPVYSPSCPIYLQNPNPSTWTNVAGGSIVPMDWNMEGGYFNHNVSPITWDDVEESVRDGAVSMAGASQQRALTAWPLLLFGLVEQIVHLLITIAMGITFISFGMAILFAFFKRTESIAQSLINQWIELIVQTTAISLIQALVIGFFLAGAATGSAPAIIGIGIICVVFILITMWSGIKAVWNSFNRLFNAMGQVAGGVFVSPGAITSAATTGAAAVATGGASLALSAGSNSLAGMNALYSGATPAQAAGLTFGGSQVLSGVTRTLAHMPGLRGTALGDAAEQFAEGAATREVARHIPMVGRIAGPMVGGMLLTDRDPEKARYDEYGRVISRPMLVPAVGEALESWTTPIQGQKRKRGAGTADDVDWFEDEEGNLTSTFRSVAPRRMGMFTPVTPVEPTSDSNAERRSEQSRQRSDYAAEMNSEEMEQHISEQLGANRSVGGGDMSRLEQVAIRLEQSAEAITRAAREQMMLGQLKVTGGGDVASVLGDVVRLTQTDRIQQGRDTVGGIDHLTVADTIARVVGVTPDGGAHPPVQNDLARFGLFTDQALRLGISGSQAEQVIREVKSSPESQITDQTRTILVEQVRAERNVSYDTAQEEVNRLEHTARVLPNEITTFGMMGVSMPEVRVEVQPQVTVEPQIDVQVDTPQPTAYDEAAKTQAGLTGSERVTGGEG
ncbi:MAG: hypothetical protein K8L97_08485 [Anaerolineae bacterium]|nr:hypothetical protein [Anaerolineae bacterium]